MPLPFKNVMVSIVKMDIHDMTVRCWGTVIDLVLFDIILGPVAKEDMIAFLHVKRVDCLLRPCLKCERKKDYLLTQMCY